ncbi:MAG: hypothetical protein ACI9SY_000677 [Candidatus Paceibacteria bacterium]|jgi:uncharacterized protein YerC
MVRLNKNSLNDKQFEKLVQQLNVTLSKSNEAQVDQLVSGLLGYEERIMIAKRLGVILLLQKGYNPYTVSQILNISPSTAGRIQTEMQSGNYDPALRVIKKDDKSYQAILRTIDSILTAGGIMPHYGQKPRNI